VSSLQTQLILEDTMEVDIMEVDITEWMAGKVNIMEGNHMEVIIMEGNIMRWHFWMEIITKIAMEDTYNKLQMTNNKTKLMIIKAMNFTGKSSRKDSKKDLPSNSASSLLLFHS